MGERFSIPLQTGPGAHPTSYTNDKSLFSEGKVAVAYQAGIIFKDKLKIIKYLDTLISAHMRLLLLIYESFVTKLNIHVF